MTGADYRRLRLALAELHVAVARVKDELPDGDPLAPWLELGLAGVATRMDYERETREETGR